MFGLVGRFFSLVVDTENDVILASSQAVDDSLLDYYCHPCRRQTLKPQTSAGNSLANSSTWRPSGASAKRKRRSRTACCEACRRTVDEAREQWPSRRAL
jgi:hypothetical protein